MCQPSLIQINAAAVELRLEDAGKTLLSLPWSGCFPSGFSSVWPLRAACGCAARPVPSSREISAMDEAYRWMAFLPDVDERRLVLMRSLALPDSPFGTPRHVWSWSKLRRTTGLHPDTLKARWGRGIDRIVRGLAAPDARRRLPPVTWPGCQSVVPTVT
jgi:hypothetical protein